METDPVGKFGKLFQDQMTRQKAGQKNGRQENKQQFCQRAHEWGKRPFRKTRPMAHEIDKCARNEQVDQKRMNGDENHPDFQA
ncbi:MAG: hypothetical protein ACYCOX_01575 [Acidobacteriaceae bacterium]